MVGCATVVVSLLDVPTTVCLASNKRTLILSVRFSIKSLYLASFVTPGSLASQDLSYFQATTESVFAFFDLSYRLCLIQLRLPFRQPPIKAGGTGFEPVKIVSDLRPMSYNHFPRGADSVASYPFEIRNTTPLITFICRLLVDTLRYFGHFSPFSFVLLPALSYRIELL